MAEREVPRLRPCPICHKLALREFHPFCSDRCKQVDLGRWLGGNYAIPVVEDETLPEGSENDDR